MENKRIHIIYRRDVPSSENLPFIPASDISPAQWVCDGLKGFVNGVLSVVPERFPAHARIYHPAYKISDKIKTPLRWSEVAKANGRETHREMQWWNDIAYETPSYVGNKIPSDIWQEFPEEGSLPSEIADILCKALSPHTSTSGKCWFAIWEGFGRLHKGVRNAPSFEVPARKMHLLYAPINEVSTSFCHREYQSANIWWPDDKAWLVATDIDFNTTYVGGSKKAISSLIENTELEVDLVNSFDKITAN